MKIYIYPNGDKTYQVAINSKQGCEDYIDLTWDEVLALLQSLTAPK